MVLDIFSKRQSILSIHLCIALFFLTTGCDSVERDALDNKVAEDCLIFSEKDSLMFFKHNFYVNQDDKLANQSYQSFKNYSWRRSYANNSVQIFRLYDRYSSMMDKPIAFFIKYCSEDSSNNYIFKSNGSFSFWTIWMFENEDRNDFYTKVMYKDV